ncbi:MAG: universal stress protein [Cyclobacteriaceae bacterium]|nr:universal stress protein [Cyclobacteriaceae bacterium]MDH4296044.1 universal stress protein [Cyclobacteriaceae bacterium]MDH5249812.1 universal stress protein [Cyclobacteriaceae bacterium]
MEKYEIRRVLVPVDFSQVAVNALETAVAICKRQLTTLTLIHVVENTFRLVPPEAGATVANILPGLVKKANESLNELAKRIRTKHDLVVNHVVQSGNPADEICGWAHQKEVDLIVMGTHGSSGLREFFIGSNAYRVVKNAPCPVMTIPGTRTWIDFKNILFPIRMVPNALDKYEVIRPIVRKNSSSLLIAGIVKENDASGFDKMKELVDTVSRKIDEDQVSCRSKVLYSEDVARQVLAVSEVEKPDLIVITATLDSSLKDFFLGPYTQDIVNHARFPVLSIRPQAPIENIQMQPQRQREV